MMLIWFWRRVDLSAEANVSEKQGFSPEDGDSVFLRYVGIYLRVYTAPESRNVIIFTAPKTSSLTQIDWLAGWLTVG
jgi:hypothetical protein